MANNTVISLVLKAKDQASGVLTGAAAKITALMAAFGGSVAINKALEDLTEMDKVAQRLSMSVEELGAGQYAAFKLAGVGAEEYADAITEVRIKMEEWSSINSGGATDFFEIMKTDVQEFMKLNPQDQFLKIADTMKDMSESAQFTFLDQIGSDVLRNMLPAIKQGGDEFRRTMEQAQKYNQVVSNIDAKAIRSLNTEFQMLGKIADGTFKKAFSGIAPELQALVQIVQEKMLEISGAANGPISSIGDTFIEMVETVLRQVSILARVKDTFDVLFYTLKSSALLFVAVFLTGMQEIGDGVVKVMNGVEKTLRSAFAGFIALVNNALIKPTAQNLGALGFDDMANKLNAASLNLEKYRNDIKSKPPTLQAPDIRPTIKKLKELKEESDKALGDNIDLVIKGTFDDKAAMEAIVKRRDAIRADQAKELADEEKHRKETLAKGGDAKFGAANATSAAAIASSQAKLRADLARADIESTIQTIESKKEIELAGLDERARLEGLSANKIADLRLEIELEAAQKINEQRRKSIDEDIKELQVQIEGQRSILSQEASDAGRGGAAAAIAELEAEITRKKREQVALNGELVNQSALLKANRAAELGTLKAELKEINEQAKLELRILRGDSVSVELEKVEKELGQTVKDMEEVGLDSDVVKNLLSAKLAEIELNDIESQFESLKKKLEKRKISPFEYLNQVGELEQKGAGKAEEVGDPDRVEAFAEAAKNARAEVFDLDKMVSNAADSLTSGLEGLFGDFISGTKSAKEAFSDFAQGVLMDIGKMIGKLLVQLAIQSMLSAFSGGTSTAASGAFSGLLNAGVNHSGGLAGSGNRRRLAPAGWFSGAPKYHTGGVVGLKANEVPIVAERGEEILTESDPRHRKNQGKNSSVKEEKQPINVINMLDNSAIARAALESPEGERMVLNIIKANKGSLNM